MIKPTLGLTVQFNMPTCVHPPGVRAAAGAASIVVNAIAARVVQFLISADPPKAACDRCHNLPRRSCGNHLAHVAIILLLNYFCYCPLGHTAARAPNKTRGYASKQQADRAP